LRILDTHVLCPKFSFLVSRVSIIKSLFLLKSFL
jgi:hypothetical protein